MASTEKREGTVVKGTRMYVKVPFWKTKFGGVWRRLGQFGWADRGKIGLERLFDSKRTENGLRNERDIFTGDEIVAVGCCSRRQFPWHGQFPAKQPRRTILAIRHSDTAHFPSSYRLLGVLLAVLSSVFFFLRDTLHTLV